MKKQFLLILMGVFFYGCWPVESLKDRYYIIENQSNHSIILKFYINGVLIDYNTTSLPVNGDKYKGSMRYEKIVDVFGFPRSAYRSADSIVIDFDAVKRQFYTIDQLNRTLSEPIDRNIFRHENYQQIENDRFLFKITEEDYSNAEDI